MVTNLRDWVYIHWLTILNLFTMIQIIKTNIRLHHVAFSSKTDLFLIYKCAGFDTIQKINTKVYKKKSLIKLLLNQLCDMLIAWTKSYLICVISEKQTRSIVHQVISLISGTEYW